MPGTLTVEKLISKLEIDEEGCFLWTGCTTQWGHGSYGGQFTHRFAYETFVGPIPAGLVLDHLCRRPACMNPDHLEPVTQKENSKRGLVGTKTVCVNGHEYTPENTYLKPNGNRNCRECARIRNREYKERNR